MLNMILIFETQYYKLSYMEDMKILYIDWFESTHKILLSEFKQHILDLIPHIETYKLSGFLVNSQKGHLTMGIEIQE